MNPENADGLWWAHSLTGEVEGSVPGDVHALRLLGKVRKSCRERVNGRNVSNPQAKAEP